MRNLSMHHQPHLLTKNNRFRGGTHRQDMAVGLGIVAAMSTKPTPTLPRSDPIPIVSPRPRETVWGIAAAAEEDEEEEMMSESYTCVISHVAGDAVKKREYFDDGSDGMRRNYEVNSAAVFFQSPLPPPAAVKTVEFLKRCYLCTKWLHGLDIFIYRGDKSFCSSECRFQQIHNDEYRENCSSGALKQFEYSVSPCSTPLLFSAGVAAA